MLLPSIFDNNFMDSFFDDMFTMPRITFSNNASTQMHTDVQEYDDRYELDIELPGFKKEDIKAELKDGYLTIAANKQTANEEKDNKGRYIRRERYVGQCQRSFYVGKDITEEDIKAGFNDGILKVAVPKKEKNPEIEEKRYIRID